MRALNAVLDSLVFKQIQTGLPPGYRDGSDIETTLKGSLGVCDVEG